jgi:hypothetical protein
MQISTAPYFEGIKRRDTLIHTEGDEIEILQQKASGDYETVRLNAKHKRGLYDALHREFQAEWNGREMAAHHERAKATA